MPRILLTGAAGFVGSRLAERLGPTCRGLVRRPPRSTPGWQPVVGDLLEPDAWEAALEGVSTVVHLAAVTGKAPAAEHRRVNTEGTARLVGACRRHAVERLVFVSTIAVKFGDLERYPYALAKRDAEEIVAGSGLRTTIVRPTMVLGAGSAILEALARLATLPLCLVFGGGKTPVQPVHVDDLVGMLVSVLADACLDGQVVEFGGPERLSIEQLLVAIRRARKGSTGPLLHLPLPLLLPLLTLGEKLAFRWMPFTVGQLATFRFDGTATAGRLSYEAPLLDVEAMVAAGGPA